MKRNNKTSGKIYPSFEFPNMINGLTLDFILTGSEIPERLENVFIETFIYDKKYLQYDGVMMKKGMKGILDSFWITIVI